MRSRITLRFLLGVIVLGSLGGVAFLVWLNLNPGPDKKSPPQKPEVVADLKLDRVHYTETREGVKEWELEAASAVFFKEENTVMLDNVRATFYGKEKESYVLIGEKGKYNTQTKVIEVYGGVKIDSSDGYHLRTRSLKYQSEQRELHTSDPVEMRGPDLEVNGVGMIVELSRQRVKILGGVTTILSSLAMKTPAKSAM